MYYPATFHYLLSGSVPAVSAAVPLSLFSPKPDLQTAQCAWYQSM